MKHWKVDEERVEWVDTESKLCSPFNPMDTLSQKLHTLNHVFYIVEKSGPQFIDYINCHLMHRDIPQYGTILHCVMGKQYTGSSGIPVVYDVLEICMRIILFDFIET